VSTLANRMADFSPRVVSRQALRDADHAEKQLRRTVDLSGEEIWEDQQPQSPPAAGGGAMQMPPVPGGVPGFTPGAEPPRWDGAGNQPRSTADLPESHDDALPSSGRVAAQRPHAAFPQGPQGMDGYWPPGGHGGTQPSGQDLRGGSLGVPPAGTARSVKKRVALADLIKVGPEGYIHGYICVRPPCGPRYAQAEVDKRKGTVSHAGVKIGKVPSKDADGKYSAIHYKTDAAGVAVREKLPARYDTAQQAFDAIPLYHNISKLAEQDAPADVKQHLESARQHFAAGAALSAAQDLRLAKNRAEDAGDGALASHIKHVNDAILGIESEPEPDPNEQLWTELASREHMSPYERDLMTAAEENASEDHEPHTPSWYESFARTHADLLDQRGEWQGDVAAAHVISGRTRLPGYVPTDDEHEALRRGYEAARDNIGLDSPDAQNLKRAIQRSGQRRAAAARERAAGGFASTAEWEADLARREAERAEPATPADVSTVTAGEATAFRSGDRVSAGKKTGTITSYPTSGGFYVKWDGGKKQVWVSTDKLSLAPGEVAREAERVEPAAPPAPHVPAAPQRVISHTQLDATQIADELQSIDQAARTVPGVSSYQSPVVSAGNAGKTLRRDDAALYPREPLPGEHAPAEIVRVIGDDLRRVDWAIENKQPNEFGFRSEPIPPAGIAALRVIRDRLQAVRDQVAAADTSSPFVAGDFTSGTRKALVGGFDEHLSGQVVPGAAAPDAAQHIKQLIGMTNLSFPENDETDKLVHDKKDRSARLAQLKRNFITRAVAAAGVPDNAARAVAAEVASQISRWSFSGNDADTVIGKYTRSMAMTEPPLLRVTDFAGRHDTHDFLHGDEARYGYSDTSPEAAQRRRDALSYWSARAQQHYTDQVLKETGQHDRPLKVVRYVYGDYARNILSADREGRSWRASARLLSSWAEPKGSSTAKAFIKRFTDAKAATRSTAFLRGSPVQPATDFARLEQSIQPDQVFAHWRGESTLRNDVKVKGEIITRNSQISSDNTKVTSAA
jgi:hypothetical protein